MDRERGRETEREKETNDSNKADTRTRQGSAVTQSRERERKWPRTMWVERERGREWKHETRCGRQQTSTLEEYHFLDFFSSSICRENRCFYWFRRWLTGIVTLVPLDLDLWFSIHNETRIRWRRTELCSFQLWLSIAVGLLLEWHCFGQSWTRTGYWYGMFRKNGV